MNKNKLMILTLLISISILPTAVLAAESDTSIDMVPSVAFGGIGLLVLIFAACTCEGDGEYTGNYVGVTKAGKPDMRYRINYDDDFP
jgi:hypothetical protein